MYTLAQGVSETIISSRVFQQIPKQVWQELIAVGKQADGADWSWFIMYTGQSTFGPNFRSHKTHTCMYHYRHYEYHSSLGGHYVV